MDSSSFPKRLLIVGRVTHYEYCGQLYAYTPYVREIDIWADLFEQINIAGTLIDAAPTSDCSPFTRRNIRVLGVPAAGGSGFKAKLLQAFALPKTVWRLASFMKDADAIHARCPSDLGMLGLVIGPLFSRKLIAKYTGQWMAFPHEAMAWKLQRAILRSAWWGGPVTVYSRGSDQPGKIFPFFTSILTDEQMHRARVASSKQRDPGFFRVLFVGRLSAARNVDTLLNAVALLSINGRQVECIIAGEGPERPTLEKLAMELGIADQTRFLGGLPFDKVLDCYESANVLVLAGESEGWGKAVTEAMAFGCVCIGGNRGMMPLILGDERGFLVEPRDVSDLQQALQYVADHPDDAARRSERSAIWAQRMSLDGLRKALREVMEDCWQTDGVSQLRQLAYFE